MVDVDVVETTVEVVVDVVDVVVELVVTVEVVPVELVVVNNEELVVDAVVVVVPITVPQPNINPTPNNDSMIKDIKICLSECFPKKCALVFCIR